MKRVKKYWLAAILLIMGGLLLGACGGSHDKNPEPKQTAKADGQASSKEKDKPIGSAGKETEPTGTPGGEKKNGETEDEAGKATPTPEPELVTDPMAIEGLAESILAGMPLNEKIGQLFILNLEGLDQSKGSYYEFKKCTKKMKNTLSFFQPGGVILFARNIETREQTTKLIEDMKACVRTPLFVGVDEEGGDVARIANNPNMRTTKFPSMEEIGKTEDTEKAYEVGKTIGKEISELGFNLDFAPVADVKTNDMNTEIGNRSFGDNAKSVGKMVEQVVKGLSESNVASALKHFPGHGDVSKDSHDGPVNVDNDLNRLRKIEFVPFKYGIKAGADFVMLSHISISRVTENTVPASLSKTVIRTLLKDELDFDGIAVTDAMNMEAITKNYDAGEAAVLAIKAGEDMILMPEDFYEAFQAVWEAVESGKIKEKRIDESVKRILQIKIKRGLIRMDTDLLPENME